MCAIVFLPPDPSYSIYDIIGCSYNMPAAYAPNEFLSCDGDLQDEVGTYTSNGQSEYSLPSCSSHAVRPCLDVAYIATWIRRCFPQLSPGLNPLR